MSLLTVIQRFCDRTGIKKPLVAVQSTDKQIVQLIGLANELVEDLAITRKIWTQQQREYSFTSIGGLTQIADISAVCPGYVTMVRDTIFDRTSHLRIDGPLSEQDWQVAQAVTYSSAYASYRIVGNALKLYPQITVGHEIAFEYKSTFLIYDNTTLAFKEYFTNDTDTFALPEVLLISGLRWLWKKENGLPYAEEFKTYERNIASYGSSDGTPKTISMGGVSFGRTPGVFIPDSNWNL